MNRACKILSRISRPSARRKSTRQSDRGLATVDQLPHGVETGYEEDYKIYQNDAEFPPLSCSPLPEPSSHAIPPNKPTPILFLSSSNGSIRYRSAVHDVIDLPYHNRLEHPADQHKRLPEPPQEVVPVCRSHIRPFRASD
ncbi:hypothetical protein FGB62_401g02 [Gracilaria domingensis]|nr:hypothetical protein FGB62_401g02 [Gracilaria domingensis]